MKMLQAMEFFDTCALVNSRVVGAVTTSSFPNSYKEVGYEQWVSQCCPEWQSKVME